jgi:hypothetical protein
MATVDSKGRLGAEDEDNVEVCKHESWAYPKLDFG